ncbi:prolyl oligopeptidase family serine peptidase [Burkholderia sp. FERM BP-3421]|uniref:prolyl oligopeptidase family serine peptidase n=1 Tax=Burkholderia sp. FERM BP-3421 TaxID=1494466 RepID=UPI0023614B0F|nr:prolyl oligopeptidase family serine peptidase [Burkholderia sp. FERM BP-3421]WDD94599.1 prolyl oligopeptidase family serine peptidase [Burkholderia sp. FERM BP-3421]
MSASSVWPATPDPFLFLEDLDSPRAREWVDAQNARTRAAWRDGAAWRALADRLARAYLPRDAPVIPERWQSWAYDLLQDDRHPKGVWRRAPWADWRAGAPVWETLLDIDALGEEEGEPWVFEGHAILYPDGDRALLSLSPGGSDAVVVREFDLTQRRFVADGFTIDTPGHHTLDWINRDTVYASWDRGDASLTRSGYPFEVRRWARGAALAQAPVVFRGEYEDISAGASFDPVDARHVAWRSVDFFDVHTYRLDADGAWARYDVPSHVGIGHWRGWLVFEPRLDWTCGGVRHPGGALLAIREDAFLAGARDCFTLFSPSASTSACTWTATRHYLLASWLDDVDSRTELWQPLCDDAGGWSWRSRPFDGPAGAQIGVEPIESLLNDEVYVDIDTYLNPPECWLADLADDAPARRVLLDRPPVQFDAAGLVVRRAHARSRDGTPVPYTLIGPRDALEGAARTARPCLLAGYGGFALPNLAAYSDGLGIGWLEQGGVAVFAHIRGGGEFGPDWHLDAQREHRQCAFDDFIAIAEQLIADGVTTAAQLGIEGGSNGGLLVGACMVQRPELFGAVLCQVPLLDMQRYPLLHAGSAWLDEYGDPDDPDEAAALAAYSPYHRVAAGVAYPPLLLTTSTRDDRVHPAHARKMAARMRAQGHERVWYWENTDGGHGSADDLARAEDNAAEFGFLWAQLGPAAPRV